MSGTVTAFNSMISSNTLSLSAYFPKIPGLGHLIVLMDFTNGCGDIFLFGYSKLGSTSCGNPAAM
mgnify:CR=1 FL=1